MAEVFTTLNQTRQIAQGAAQGALDLVAQQNYVKLSEVDNELSKNSPMPVQNKVITAELDKKVSAEVIEETLMFS